MIHLKFASTPIVDVNTLNVSIFLYVFLMFITVCETYSSVFAVVLAFIILRALFFLVLLFCHDCGIILCWCRLHRPFTRSDRLKQRKCCNKQWFYWWQVKNHWLEYRIFIFEPFMISINDCKNLNALIIRRVGTNCLDILDCILFGCRTIFFRADCCRIARNLPCSHRISNSILRNYLMMSNDRLA